MDAPTLHRVLLVDDNDDDHLLLCAILRRGGIPNPVDYMFRGEDAVDYLLGCLAGLRAWPCVMVVDIHMPGMDGFELLRWARERGVGGKTVIALMSTSTRRADISLAFSLGAHAYISKSAHPQSFLELVRIAACFASPDLAAAAASTRKITALENSTSPWNLH